MDIEKPVCIFCDKEFCDVSTLRRHQKNVHFIITDLRFVNDESHKVGPNVNNESSKAFKCTQCEKEFDRKGKLEIHIQTHVKNLTRMENLKCLQCEKQFDRKDKFHFTSQMFQSPEECIF